MFRQRPKHPGQAAGSGIVKIAMAEVIELKRDKQFTLKEAKVLLPVVKKITQEAINKAEKLEDDQEFSRIVEHWAQKIVKLGCEPKGLWLVDFNNGSGYYCWHYPEADVEFYHSYEGGFKGRTPIL